MLKKELMIVGSRVKVRAGNLKDGLTGVMGLGNNAIPHLRMMQSAGSIMNGHRAIHPNTELEIVRGPKRTGDGGNTAIVKEVTTGAEGHIWWCELRANCDHLAGTAPAGSTPITTKPKKPSKKDLMVIGAKIVIIPTGGTNYAALYPSPTIKELGDNCVSMNYGEKFELLSGVEKLDPNSSMQLVKLRRLSDGHEGYCPWMNLMSGYKHI